MSVLPAPVSPVMAVRPGPASTQVEVGDDAEVDDVQLDQHLAARYRSARPNLALRIWWKSRGPKVTMRAGSATARARHRVAGGELAELAPVER